MPHATPARPYALALTAAWLVLTAGCSTLRLGFGSASRLESSVHPVRLDPDFTTRVYAPVDRNTADLYLTDLPPEAFDNPERLAQSSGQLAHIHLFIRPTAGSTPIDTTAVSATVRYFVLARGRVGVYAGGGFLFPRDRVGERRFAFSFTDASVRHTAAGPGFIDQIETGSLDLRTAARLDEDAANLLRRTADRLALSADPIQVSDRSP